MYCMHPPMTADFYNIFVRLSNVLFEGTAPISGSTKESGLSYRAAKTMQTGAAIFTAVPVGVSRPVVRLTFNSTT